MTEIMVYIEDYQQPATYVSLQSRRISRWIIANRFSYQQVIHILLSLHVFISEKMIHGLERASQMI
jgi:quinol-cytochrome oxidoreductase complex cytochrome b subunit